MTDYSTSKTFAALAQLFQERWEEGERKYGKHIDEMVVPTDITGETSWAQMALNEMLDGVVYSIRAQEEHEKNLRIQKEAKRLLDEYKALKESHSQVSKELEELKREYRTQEEFYEAQLQIERNVNQAVRSEYEFFENISVALRHHRAALQQVVGSAEVLSRLLGESDG
jgi:vacuolar-type H+-ATPase subunit I/STV1